MGPAASTTARSTTFSSSRTLPGQRCSRIHASASAASRRAACPARAVGVARGSARRAAGCPRGARAAAAAAMVMTFEPVVEVLAEAPLAAPSRGEVAGWWRRPGGRRRWTARLPADAARSRLSWSTRSSLTCSGSGRSRRSRRGTACRRRPPRTSPSRPAVAPVNAPFSWPNSSLSSSVSGSAAQLTATNGPRRAARSLVERARDQLLAGAALAEDQHGGVASARPARRCRAASCMRGDAPDDARRADAALELRAQRAVLDDAGDCFSSALRTSARRELAELERLGQVVVGALRMASTAVSTCRTRSSGARAGAGCAPAAAARTSSPSDVVHHEVGEDHVELRGRDARGPARPPAASRPPRALALEVACRSMAEHVRVVVDDQHPARAHPGASAPASRR